MPYIILNVLFPFIIAPPKSDVTTYTLLFAMTGVEANVPSRETATGTDDEVSGNLTAYKTYCPEGVVPRLPSRSKFAGSGRDAVATSKPSTTTGLDMIPFRVIV